MIVDKICRITRRKPTGLRLFTATDGTMVERQCIGARRILVTV